MTIAEELSTAFKAAADPARAGDMARYMRDQFAFFGIGSADRRALQRPIFARHRSLERDELITAALDLWELPERELQYAACDLLIRHVKRLDGDALPDTETLITTKSWWDTVDPLATRVIGSIVLADRSLDATIDEWIDSDDIWLVRTAILHQLNWKERTDEPRLFALCLRRASESEFFIRKAIGWALRQHARVAPDRVRRFVDEHDAELSGLSKREALKHLTK